MKDNAVLDKSKQFAVRAIKLYQYLTTKKKEFIISKQLFRSGTSIGANVKEAQGAQSRKDFRTKLNIALKEAKESEYWLELLNETGYLSKKEYDSIVRDCDEINRLLVAIIKTTNYKLKTSNSTF